MCELVHLEQVQTKLIGQANTNNNYDKNTANLCIPQTAHTNNNEKHTNSASRSITLDGGRVPEKELEWYLVRAAANPPQTLGRELLGLIN